MAATLTNLTFLTSILESASTVLPNMSSPVSTAEEPFQSFRAIYRNNIAARIIPTPEIIKIRSRFDGKTGKYVILILDVEMNFRNFQQLLQGDVAVTCLTDDNLVFLEPLRFIVAPDIVMDVLVESDEYQSQIDSQDCDEKPSIAERPSPFVSTIQTSQPEEISVMSQIFGGGDYNHSAGNQSGDLTPAAQGHRIDINHDDKESIDQEANPISQDYDMAPELFQAAEQGHTNAQYRLAEMYENGELFDMNARKASEWYLKSANLGNTKAQRKIGMMYKHGHGVPEDYTEARRWFKTAADQGDTHSQVELGFMVKNGQGGPKDLGKALEHFGKAIGHGLIKGRRICLISLILMSPDELLELLLFGISYHLERGIERSFNMAEQSPAAISQAFRAIYCNAEMGSSPLHNPIKIPTRFDSSSGKHIILLDDVIVNFKGALRILNGDTAVQYLTDNDFQYLTPRRFEAVPDVVLDVVIDDRPERRSTSTSDAS
ncbi:hypothetical protein BGX27_008166 [Mortierella sp. AM989]|nr:hypothetical protein BGX27_008166 [Mortierella sp. AM989]